MKQAHILLAGNHVVVTDKRTNKFLFQVNLVKNVISTVVRKAHALGYTLPQVYDDAEGTTRIWL